MAIDYLKDKGINSTFKMEGGKGSLPIEVFVDEQDYEEALDIIKNAESLTAISLGNSNANSKFQKIYFLIIIIAALITTLIFFFSK